MTLGTIPVQEIPVLENLITIRHKLSALKKDRESYPKPDIIVALYEETEKEVERIGSIRQNKIWEASTRNRVNDVLDDVMSLLSLFFMSIGRNRESPAVYAQLITVERYLDQLSQMGIYTDSILIEIEERLQDIADILEADSQRSQGTHSYFLDLLKQKHARCKSALESLLITIRDVSPKLKPTQEALVDLRRELSRMAQNPNGFTANDIHPFQEKLRQIDHAASDILASKDGPKPKGHALIIGLLEQLYEETHDLVASTDNVSEALVPIADRLKQIKAQLERLALTHRWTLRETDLYTFQLQLQEIEKLRHNGKFRDSRAPEAVPDGQALINFLLRGCYRLMSKMLSENVPVAEALMPVHNQLSTLRRCLVEVTKWGKPDSARDLYPYQMKLASIDNMRINGVFYDEEGNIPEGQAICIALLNECYDIIHDLIAALDDDKLAH
ncbi:uncharacterized protein BYT42DRAFT_576373 [Radiomyces spectabilis]|uniref:uncharacterized protein n=1 Tax=Radiomyces spectabilis TaxID=64574 RepID=UPI00222053B2|nr:uncharacterized protein BYT42DRAFT_576373 [Radiomyces spectabilis]KAI8374443.1 hypothetical protein BYT42DRAFT_576373 [Radiomyces spectabilis]